jgi:hypothetical protein
MELAQDWKKRKNLEVQPVPTFECISKYSPLNILQKDHLRDTVGTIGVIIEVSIPQFFLLFQPTLLDLGFVSTSGQEVIPEGCPADPAISLFVLSASFGSLSLKDFPEGRL